MKNDILGWNFGKCNPELTLGKSIGAFTSQVLCIRKCASFYDTALDDPRLEGSIDEYYQDNR